MALKQMLKAWDHSTQIKEMKNIGLETTDLGSMKNCTAKHFVLENFDYLIAQKWKGLKA